MRYTKLSALAAALLIATTTACADLTVPNENAPNREQALASAGDVESLIAGAFANWYRANGAYAGISMALGNMSFEYASSAANSGAVFYSAIPRPEIVNQTTGQYYPNFEYVYLNLYRSIAAVATGLDALEDEEMASELSESRLLRAQAYGKFVQGIAHATVAIMFDRGFIIDETTELTDASGAPITQETVPYQEVMAAAQGYLQEAIDLASSGEFNVPESWMTEETSSSQLARIASSLKARYRAAVVRTPEEADAVDWQTVLDELDAGLDEDWLINLEYVYNNWLGNISHLYTSQPATWAYTTYWIEGMADQDGHYQEWLSEPVNDRHPILETEEPFLIHTPDQRFPQGETLEEQLENPGTHYMIYNQSFGQWGRPDRGTWRWSYYDDTPARDHNRWLWCTGDPTPGCTEEAIELAETIPEYSHKQMRLLAAEAHYRLGNEPAAALIIDETRVPAGLNSALIGNTSCVPKLPNEECGDLFEMLKWEKRVEGKLLGLVQAPGYFDSRRWGDLYVGTALHFPIPVQELQTLQMEEYTTGGVGSESGSDGSTYNWEDFE